MKRLVIAVVVGTALVVSVVVARRTIFDREQLPANPAGFVASDVTRLATTGRPQLVEVFHYG
jgi:hypothetical protein